MHPGAPRSPAAFGADVPSDGTLLGLGAVGGLAAAAGAASLAGFHWPCPWLASTGLFCPFCGSTAALLAVVDGDIGAALGSNAPVLIAGAALAMLWTVWTLRRFGIVPRLPRLPGPRARRWILGLVATLAIGFTALRNLPWPPFTGLAP